MPFIDLSDVDEKEIIPGFRGRIVHSRHMTFVLWNIASGSSLPEHFHPSEQITTVIQGTFEMTIDGEMQTMTPGTVAIIPANVKHKGKSISDTQLIDAFYPVREDYR
jgi:quercetin dioxygenase-like cupin family protein